MNDSVLEFYKIARTDEALVATLGKIEDADAFAAEAVKMAADRGYSLTMEDAKSCMANFDELIDAVSNDDDVLTDFELELVAAGAPVNCNSGSTTIHT